MRRSLEVFRTWQERYSEDIGWQQHGYIFPVYREADETMLRNLMDVRSGLPSSGPCMSIGFFLVPALPRFASRPR